MYVYTCRSLRSNSSFGGVLKRLKRPHLKCGRSVSSRRVGSNPTSSAFCSKASEGFTFQRFLFRVCWSLNAMPLRPFPAWRL